MKMTMKTLSVLIKPYKTPDERFYLLKSLIPLMVEIDYFTVMPVIVIIC